MKKAFIIILTLLLFIYTKTLSIVNNQLTKDLSYVTFNTTNNKEFRGVWISTLTSDIEPYSGEASFKSEMNKVFTVMEYYKLNAMIFHIRTHNNALYKSKLNPVAGWWKTVNFDKFDPLEWLIDECHKRGIEFHAWMNPYRLGNSHYYGSTLPSANPANNSKNTVNSILNPGLPNVREFLINTVMEVIENYDVDAIHFDDYFYTNLGANGALNGTKTILDEPDQATFVANPGNYNTASAYDKADWRRDQVSLFIEGLSNEIKSYNLINNKHIGLGISPTGIYNNGDGVVDYDEDGKPITTGSLTSGQAHYASYLFADTLKWISEGWLDYILPQSYWATDHNAGPYYNVMGWWDKVVKRLDVNLYSGIGIYQADEENRFAWMDDETELFKQLDFVNKSDNIKGVCFYSYKHLRNAYNGAKSASAKQLANIGNTIWLEKKLLPEIKSMEPVVLGQVNNFNIKNNTLTWDKLDNAKFYVIYRDKEEIAFSDDQIIDVIGSKDSLVTYSDKVNESYYYGVKALSYTNTLGEGAIPNIVIEPVFEISFYADNILIAKFKSNELFDLPKITFKNGYDKIPPVWNKTDFSNLTTDIRVDAVYYINEYEVKFYDKDGVLIENIIAKHGQTIIAPIPPVIEGYEFKGWDEEYSEIESDLEIRAVYVKTNGVDYPKEEDPKFSCKYFNFSSLYIVSGFILILFFRRRK